MSGTYFRNLLCRGVSDFRDVSINLQMYLEMALDDVFVQLDSTKRGRIMFSDFEKLCEEFGFANSHYNGKNYHKLVKDAKGNSPNSVLKQNEYLWTIGQRPYWELWKRKSIKSLNFDEFKISLLGRWTTKYDCS